MRFTPRRAAALVAAASLGGAAVVALPASASTPTWVATQTHAITYTGKVLGSTRPGRTLHLTIALSPRHASEEATALRALYTPGSPTYHQYLTPAEWNAEYAPTKAQAAKVRNYLASRGFTAIHTMGDRLAITADATVAQAERAFRTRLVDYRLGRHRVYGNTAPAKVPAALGSIVTAVIGLNNLPLTAVKPVVRSTTAAGSPSTAGLFPAQFETTYDAVGTKPGTRTNIAIFTEGDTSGVIKSLRYAEMKENQPKIPVTVKDIGAQSTDTAGADEFDMDSQVSTMVSGGVRRLYMYNVGSLVDSQIVAAFAAFVSQDHAKALSASIGGCELNSYLDGSEMFTDVVMQQGAMQGQSLFASSGDNGDACMYVAAIGFPIGVPGVNWPASGAFTTAVGGTSLVTDSDGNRIQELAWLGSGGGDSYVENPGWWTQDTNAVMNTEYVTGGREVPDISLDADPNLATPAKIYVGKTIMYVGGTSLSSPMMLGFWARLESAHQNDLGLASIPLYQVYDAVNPGITQQTPIGLPVVVPNPNPSAVPGLTDIVIGSNGLYQATPGYDLTTGLGAPDVKALDKVIH